MSVPKKRFATVAKRTVKEFIDDDCTDLAAALTYYSVLAIFPAIVALMALLGVVGQADKSVTTILDIIQPLVSDQMLGDVEPVIRQLAESQAAGFALVAGLLGALWSASAYVNAFSRAMNRIYEVEEGRPIWKLRPQMVLVTLVSIVLLALAAIMLVVSGGLARSIGDVLGLGDTAVLVWNIAKWPALVLVAMFLLALLYWATPNVKHPKFRWLTPGALLALLVWVLASVGLTFYVSNFSNYDKTYGSLAGVIVGLLFLWVSNLALLVGAEVDAEIERGRELEKGLAAESQLQLPLRDTRQIDKAQKKEQKQVGEAREWRLEESEDQLVPGRSPAETHPEAEGRGSRSDES
ncbi:YihY/virulence factor BrkB family protein [Nocardioides gilvus]|uniref:YihY/virulence factor BrkB family protein n=1 Tax=Nocardioides gilvus TaxID=1735589 RepID=UPI0013A53A4D|nr:YihY/virulence factor BrkB family protein [Nocardioides gilvus]